MDVRKYNFSLFHMKKNEFFKFLGSSIRILDALLIYPQTLNSYPWWRCLIFDKKACVLEITFLENGPLENEPYIYSSLFENL